MINTTFNIGITTGSAVGGLILAASNSTVVIIASITVAAAIIGISLIHRWLPADARPSLHREPCTRGGLKDLTEQPGGLVLPGRPKAA